jgi:hypothetical protein
MPNIIKDRNQSLVHKSIIKWHMADILNVNIDCACVDELGHTTVIDLLYPIAYKIDSDNELMNCKVSETSNLWFIPYIYKLVCW